MKQYKILIQAFALFMVAAMYGQQQPSYTLYRYTMNVINPAFAAADGAYSFNTNFRSQWVSVEGGPETQSFFYAQPINDKIGVGLTIVNDAIFVENRTHFNIDVSYRLQVSETANLFLGLKGGGSTYNVDRDRLSRTGFGVDPALNNIDEAFRPNFGAGAYLVHDKYFVSLSVPSLLSNERIDNNGTLITQATDEAHVYLGAGYNFRLNDSFEFRPSTLIRYVSGSPVSADITAAVRFIERFEIGAAYRTGQAVSGLLMLNLADWMDLGYAYDSSTRNQFSDLNDGTHEVFLRFRFPQKAKDN